MSLQILFLEPFYGGSHKDFADGLIAASRHSFSLYTLPARFWKWRMRGAALHFFHTLPDPSSFDLVLTSDMQNISDLKALWGRSAPPIIVYFHENQLSYPVPKGEERDKHFGFTDITSCLAADRIVFNSYFHYDTFFKELPRFLREMPEYRPTWAVEAIRKKASVLYPGCRLEYIDGVTGEAPAAGHSWETNNPVILWNHRWEYDKDPQTFFKALYELEKTGDGFSLALAGENFQTLPKPFLQGKEHFGDKIIQYGFIPSKRDYFRLLSVSDIVVSTAVQENFGISVVEAAASGCYPLLPNRLSYPEIIPELYHEQCLYNDTEELVTKLRSLLRGERPPAPDGLAETLLCFDWKIRVEKYDAFFEDMPEGPPVP